MRLSRPQLLRIAAHHAHLPGTILLYSGGTLDSSERSLLFVNPVEVVEGSAWEEVPTEPFWVGFLGYEMGAVADPDRQWKQREALTPHFRFQRCATVLEVNHRTGEATVHGEPIAFDEADTGEVGLLKLVKHDSEEEYCAKIERVKEHLRAGDIYQMCLSQEFRFEGRVDPWALFLRMAERNPSPFSAYCHWEDFSIVSYSPERFLRHSGGVLETRPIKGTASRGSTPVDDERLRVELLASEKERAELLMITDLMRNDLGRWSLPGTVSVDELWRCEAYTNVFHLLSIIRSQKRPEVPPIDVLRGAFPGGSISGCPKLRALEIIDQIEQRPRGVYTGSVGYFGPGGNFDFNIAIRTLTVLPDFVQMQMGGAITIDSDPQLEYQETLHKGKTLFEVIQ